MSTELIKARSLLAGINSSLKQEKLIPAVQALRDAVLIVLRSQLMKAERDEFGQLFDKAVYSLGSDAKLREIYPLQIAYQPGQEKELLNQLSDLLKELEANKSEEVKGLLAAMQQRKEELLVHIAASLEKGKPAEAVKSADRLFKEYASDSESKGQAADLFVKAGLYKEALGYLEEALKHDPEAIHLYNRIGIVLRKLKDYKTAEKYYLRALKLCSNDEYLWFNVGRLYYETQDWRKMYEAAKRALKINPGFAEAAKMMQFAEKRMTA